jgi:hypothetical protein
MRYTQYKTHQIQAHILPKHPHITKQVKTATVQVKTTTVQYTPNEIVTIQSSTLSIRSPQCTWHFHPQELHLNSLQLTSLQNKITSHKPRQFTSRHFTSLQNKITSHKSRQFTPHHFTYLHSPPTRIPLPVTKFLTLFLNVFSLQGRMVL